MYLSIKVFYFVNLQSDFSISTIILFLVFFFPVQKNMLFLCTLRTTPITYLFLFYLLLHFGNLFTLSKFYHKLHVFLDKYQYVICACFLLFAVFGFVYFKFFIILFHISFAYCIYFTDFLSLYFDFLFYKLAP